MARHSPLSLLVLPFNNTTSTSQSLIESADNTLLEAKRLGRNRVELAQNRASE